MSNVNISVNIKRLFVTVCVLLLVGTLTMLISTTQASRFARAILVSPRPNSTLTCDSMCYSPLTITVSDASAEDYHLEVGSSLGGDDYFGGNISSRTMTITGLPEDGSTIYIRVWTKNGEWGFNDYTVTARTGLKSSEIFSPDPSNPDILNIDGVTFTVSDVGAQSYRLHIGSSVGGDDYFAENINGSRQATVTGLPASSIYVRVWTHLTNGEWVYNDYTFFINNGD